MAEKKKDPKVGTGKKPKGSGRRLYTDENPKDTVSIKFPPSQMPKQPLQRLRESINHMRERYKSLLSLNNEPKYLGRGSKQHSQKKQKNS
tara:strand:+ start:100 stop:369 length:270 start_codon:yes stop_codon:yes gene_type:complete